MFIIKCVKCDKINLKIRVYKAFLIYLYNI